MGKIKIHEIAKKLGLTSKEILEVAKKLNIEAKSHLSGVEQEEADKIEKEIAKKDTEKQEKKKSEKAEKTKKEPKKEEKAPVIIRREVIIEEEQDTKKEEIKKQSNRNNIGFVERKQNKDYNIVYRNKPSKPMTVSELFGLKKEEPKKEEVKEEVKKEIKEVVETKESKETKNEKVEKSTNIDSTEKTVKEHSNTNITKTRNNDTRNQDDRNSRNNFRNNNNRNRGQNNNQNNNFNRNNNKFNNNRNNNTERFGKRPLDEKGIEKNIKNIMATESIEKEPSREYNKLIDKQKNNNRFEENKNIKKNKNRRNSSHNDFDEGKLKSLKQTNRLSNMFDDQDGGMLDYYDLTTERGRRGKKKNKNQEQRNKQKIFQLTEIEIPETITVKDLAAEMKKTTAEVIKKLLGYGIMATINQEVDFDTAFLVAGEFGITAKKKES